MIAEAVSVQRGMELDALHPLVLDTVTDGLDGGAPVPGIHAAERDEPIRERLRLAVDDVVVDGALDEGHDDSTVDACVVQLRHQLRAGLGRPVPIADVVVGVDDE